MQKLAQIAKLRMEPWCEKYSIVSETRQLIAYGYLIQSPRFVS